MKQDYKKFLFAGLCAFISIVLQAQSNITISGNVKSSINNENISAISVVVKGSNLGTFTDDRGNFKITNTFNLPVTLIFSSVGFANKEVVISSASSSVRVVLDAVSALAQDVVVSASRLPERILESPVSIERISASAIRNSAAASYYDILGTLKGVDLTASSLNFKTPATRGFNTSGNLRLNQLVDGMDNQSPGLNFPVGTMNGLTELDVESMELLEGASSALYGPGGMNGTLLINSKDPFKYQGLSAQVRQGVMHIGDDARKVSPYYDYSLRWGQKISEKFAFKLSGQFIYAKDWVADNYANYDIGTNPPASGKLKPGTRATDPNYNGVNVYGDETTADLRPALQGLSATTPYLGTLNLPGLGDVPISTSAVLGAYTSAASLNVSRTGYKEADIINPETKNIRLSAGVYYKITPLIEASLSANWGSGTTVYTGSDRYSLKNFTIGQYKAEIKHKNWFVRAYTTQEDAGKSFNATVTTRLFNEAWKPSQAVWYPQYVQGLVFGSATIYQTALGQAYEAAIVGNTPAGALAIAQRVAAGAVAANQTAILNAARNFADNGRPQAGSAQFNHLFDSVASRPISSGGGLFIDKSALYMAEGQYNLTDIVKVAEVLVGANFKEYVLNSEGTIFADTAGRIKINEGGAYALVSKRLFKDVLKLTFSGRYDKNQNFAGHFTPRISAVVTVAKNNFFRLSYQTAYRFPSTQNQWINLGIGVGARLIGGLPALRDFYHFNTNPVYTPESLFTGNLQKQAFGEYKPEQASSYEIGYKTLIGARLLLDAYAYYTEYKNFIGRITVVQSSSADGALSGLANPNIFSVSVNSPGKVNTHGWGASAEYLLPNNFAVNANVFSDEITNVPTNFISEFNTPKYRANIGFSNTGFLYKKRVGFTVQLKYQEKVYYEADYAAGNGEVPAYQTIDAQINYKFPKIKSMVKIGATNLTNHYYITAFANPNIGGLYYVSFAYNVF